MAKVVIFSQIICNVKHTFHGSVKKVIIELDEKRLKDVRHNIEVGRSDKFKNFDLIFPTSKTLK